MTRRQRLFKGTPEKWSRKDRDPGYIYVMTLGFENLYKVGISKNWQRRLKALQAGNPKIECELAAFIGHMKREEAYAQEHLLRFHVEREIYKLSNDELYKLKLLLSKMAGAYRKRSKGTKFPPSKGVISTSSGR